MQERYGKCILVALFQSVINQWFFGGMREPKEEIARRITGATLSCEKNILGMMEGSSAE